MYVLGQNRSETQGRNKMLEQNEPIKTYVSKIKNKALLQARVYFDTYQKEETYNHQMNLFYWLQDTRFSSTVPYKEDGKPWI